MMVLCGSHRHRQRLESVDLLEPPQKPLSAFGLEMCNTLCFHNFSNFSCVFLFSINASDMLTRSRSKTAVPSRPPSGDFTREVRDAHDALRLLPPRSFQRTPEDMSRVLTENERRMTSASEFIQRASCDLLSSSPLLSEMYADLVNMSELDPMLVFIDADIGDLDNKDDLFGRMSSTYLHAIVIGRDASGNITECWMGLEVGPHVCGDDDDDDYIINWAQVAGPMDLRASWHRFVLNPSGNVVDLTTMIIM